MARNTSDYFEAWGNITNSARTMYRVVEKNLARYGLIFSEYGVLWTLVEKGPRAMVDLANEQFITQPGITSIVDRLEDEGYVERVRRKEDRRVILVRVTREGEKLFSEAHRMHKQYVRRMMSVLSRHEVDALLSAFERMSRKAEATQLEETKPARNLSKRVKA